MTDGFLILKELLYKSKIDASVALPSPEALIAKTYLKMTKTRI
jgi:hypothetical protein